MTSSNVQLQQLQTQINQLGPPPNPAVQNQITQLQARIATMDKTNIVAYSTALDQLYSLQTRYASSNSAALQDLLTQKIALLQILTQQ